MVRFVFAAFLVITALQRQTAEAQAPSHVDVVALMVEFQPDTTRFTTGDGTFSGALFEGVEAPTIDPLPHNADYFEAHLAFLSNYVARVSDGRTTVTSHVLPGIVQLSNTMGTYSPTGLDADSDEELSKLSMMVREAWTSADNQGMQLPAGLDPSTTAFVIFHAGVGRDIELVGTTLDKTPEDVPSLFFDSDALSRLGVGDLVLDGMPIRNTMVLPRTESRLGVDPLTSEPFLIELSINGLLAASFFNYLGVPDLFNTETGDSAIGPFGVMDALGIFAYSGLFPPEPSAWTKQFLGWSDAVSMGSDGRIELRATGLPGTNHAARIPISDAEYFLVENRHRDPDEDGVRLQVWTHDGVEEVVFENGDPEFNDQTVSGFPGGVVLDVDDFDFALPGGLDENDNALLGGILIWHVDENRLNDRLENNSVNADRDARAIDLEEADGAQDIGFSSSSGLFGPRFDLGTPFDFWYEGNPVTVRTNTGQDIQLYTNRFASDTTPSSATNAGGSSSVVLEDFSVPGPEMSFRVGSAESNDPSLLAEWKVEGWETGGSGAGMIWQQSMPAGFFVWQQESLESGQWAWIAAEGTTCTGATLAVQPAFDGRSLTIAAEEGVQRIRGNADGCEFEELTTWNGESAGKNAAAIEWTREAGRTRFYVGAWRSQGPMLHVVTDNGDGQISTQDIPLPDGIDKIMVTDRTGGDVILFTGYGVLNSVGQDLVRVPGPRWSQAVFAGTPTDWTLVWLDRGEGLRTLTSEGDFGQLDAPWNCEPNAPLWFDIDEDGSPDLVFSCGDRLVAMHHTGAIMAGFPVSLGSEAASRPVVARTPNGSTILTVGTQSGSVEAFVVDGPTVSRKSGFPLPVGRRSMVAPTLTGTALLTFSGQGVLRAWDVQTMDSPHPGDTALLTKAGSDTNVSESESLLNRDETYNWPNPIENGETRIRFATAEPSDVRIDIVDMNGVLVDRLETTSTGGGLPTEVTWATEAGSGVYLARVRAQSQTSSRSETRLIRMAIIR